MPSEQQGELSTSSLPEDAREKALCSMASILFALTWMLLSNHRQVG